MNLQEVNFEALQPVKKRCITFAKDGNTVVKSYKTLYSLEQITGNSAHKNLYLEIKKSKESWREIEWHLWDDVGEVCMEQGRSYENVTIEKLSEQIDKYPYFGKDGFLRQVKELEDNGLYINKVDIELCCILREVALAKHYAEYREKWIAEREKKEKAEQAEREVREREEEEKRLAEIEKALSDAEDAIKTNTTFFNYEIYGTTIVLRLFKKYGINVPLKTQGWVNNALTRITYTADGKITYGYLKSSKDSTVFYKYLLALEEKILTA